MIFLAVVLALVIVKLFGEFELNNLKIKYIGFLYAGIAIDVLLMIFTRIDMGYLTYLFVRYYLFFHVLYLLMFVICMFLNYKNTALLMVGIGFLMNLLPIMANGKMPVEIDLLKKLPSKAEIILNNNSLSHGVFDKPRLKILSDIIYLPFPYGTIISIGDILIGLGVFVAIIRAGGVMEKVRK